MTLADVYLAAAIALTALLYIAANNGKGPDAQA